MANCQICGEPMPPGEEMFKFHGYSGPCPKPPPADPGTQAAEEFAEFRRAVKAIKEDGPQAEEEQPAQEPAVEYATFRQAMRVIKEEAREMSVFTGAPAGDCVHAAAKVFVAVYH